ncbi:MAG: hypothetical protein WDN66_04485 [Candidatus Saccharibacteria bacterium]
MDSGALTVTFDSGSDVEATNNSDSSGLVGFNAGSNDITLAGTGTIQAGNAVRIGALDPTTLALLNSPGGEAFISTGLTIGNQIETNDFVPIPIPPNTPTAEIASSTEIAFLSGGTQSTTGVTVPSLTATDQTQIFGYTNLNVGLDKDEDNEYDDSQLSINNKDDSSKFIVGTTISAFHFGSDEIDRLARDGVYISC